MTGNVNAVRKIDLEYIIQCFACRKYIGTSSWRNAVVCPEPACQATRSRVADNQVITDYIYYLRERKQMPLTQIDELLNLTSGQASNIYHKSRAKKLTAPG